MLAVSAGEDCLDSFSLTSHVSLSFSLTLGHDPI